MANTIICLMWMHSKLYHVQSIINMMENLRIAQKELWRNCGDPRLRWEKTPGHSTLLDSMEETQHVEHHLWWWQ